MSLSIETFEWNKVGAYIRGLDQIGHVPVSTKSLDNQVVGC